MKFNRRMALYTLVPALLFCAALATALAGMVSIRKGFERFVGTEQRLSQALGDQYAQGLQMGQALRNILLDPANRKAYDNFDAAAKAYEQAQAAAVETAGTMDGDIATRMAALVSLRERHRQAQAGVMALVSKDGAAAVALLNSQETPAWRALKAPLQEEAALAQRRTAAARVATQQRASLALTASLALAGVAVATLLIFGWASRRTLERELGGDPAEARAALRLLAQGDLTATVHGQAGVMAELGRMEEALRRIVSAVRDSTDDVTRAAGEIAQGHQDLAARADQGADDLRQTSATMVQLTSSVRETADTAQSANTLARQAREHADRGSGAVGKVVAAMEDIRRASARIGEITSVIDGIAFQTNILALNAAVEAARAGEQGRGFAVVAGEVRSLAQRSATAAREIKALIEASVQSASEGTSLVNDAGSTMAEVHQSIDQVCERVDLIATATAAQSTGVQQVHATLAGLERMTQQNANQAEQGAQSVLGLQGQAQRLREAVHIFRLDPASSLAH